jgi:hypothetical protein
LDVVARPAVDLFLKEGRLVVEPIVKPRYELESLPAGMMAELLGKLNVLLAE